MTIASSITQRLYTGIGTTSQFSFPNKVFSASDLTVTIYDTSGNTYPFVNFANATLGWTYTVQNVDVDTGCIVVLSNVLNSGWTIDIRSVTPELQSTSVKNQGQFLPELHEEAFDKLTRMVQDLLRQSYTYGIHASDNEQTPWPALPGPTARRGYGLLFDAITGLPELGFLSAQNVTIGLLAPFLNLQQSAAEIAAGVTPINFAYAPGAVDRYGNNTTPGATDMLSAITNAIAVANATTPSGGQVTFLANTYFHSGTITMKPHVILQGQGVGSTILLSSHTGAGMKLTNPFNGSHAADTSVRDLQLWNTNGGNADGGYVDLAGTNGELRNVRVIGYKYSVILNQSELWEIDKCDLESPLTGCIWFVNGTDYVAGANPGFTNRIRVSRCQLNNAPTAIIDDGGTAHNIDSCNFNACSNHLRLAGTINFKLTNCESESNTGYTIVTASTTFNSAASVGSNVCLTIDNNYFAPPSNELINVGSGTLTSLTFTNNRCTTSAPCISGTVNINTVMAYGNLDSNVDQLFDGLAGNHFETAVAEGKFITNGKFGVNGVTSPPAQSTGWGTPTSPSVVTNYSGSAATLVQTSEAVAQIITYLKARGDFGA
jgi:hypothetical protein